MNDQQLLRIAGVLTEAADIEEAHPKAYKPSGKAHRGMSRAEALSKTQEDLKRADELEKEGKKGEAEKLRQRAYDRRDKMEKTAREKQDEALIRESRQKANGDCYQAAGQYMMSKCQFDKFACDDMVIVHGEVMGQGQLMGVTFGHAWIESNNMVIDVSNGRNITLPIGIYYAIGMIGEIDNFIKYTWEEAREKITEFEHWGPWDLETSSGL